MQSPGLSDATNGGLAERLVTRRPRCDGQRSKIGVPFGTDAAAIARAGVPSVVFGPGSIDQAHTADEWVPLAEVEQAAEILYRFASDLASDSRTAEREVGPLVPRPRRRVQCRFIPALAARRGRSFWKKLLVEEAEESAHDRRRDRADDETAGVHVGPVGIGQAAERSAERGAAGR